MPEDHPVQRNPRNLRGAPHARQADTHGMELILRLTAPPGVRLEGTVGLGGPATSLPFSGVMELLARIEQLADDLPGAHDAL
jgi:hypothetical protein